MQHTYNLACVPPTSVSGCGGCPCSHTARISRIASTRFRRNVSVEVSGHETLDSIPNLITLSPARSARDRRYFESTSRDLETGNSQLIPYPFGYTAPKPVPWKRSPALSPLVERTHS